MADPALVNSNIGPFQEGTVNAAPQFLFGTMEIQDPDEDFNGGSLVISGLLPEDIITFLNFGTGPAEPSFNSGTGEISIGGVVVGVLTGGSGGADLVITFNGNADSWVVSMVLMNLMYQNTSDAPTQDRELTLTVTDAAGNVALMHVDPGWEQLTGGQDPFAGLGWIDSRLSPVFGDIDGDGDLDVLLGTYNGDFAYLENTGSASAPVFEQRDGQDNPFDGLAVGGDTVPTFVDLDADGDLDLVANSYGGGFRTYINDGSGNFTDQTGTAPPQGVTTDFVSAAAFGDLDGDGDLDLIVANFNGVGLFYRNEGAAASAQFTYISVATGLYMASGAQRHHLHDVDGDGDLDVVAGNPLGSDIQYFENTGNASNAVFTQRTGGDNPFDGISVGFYSAVTFADIDGDGLDELIIGDNDGVLKAYRYEAGGDLTPTFALVVNPEDEVQNGASGPDTLIGGATPDELNGLDGADLLKGGLGGDSLNGGAGDDNLRGEGGDDTLDGGDDNDMLIGGDGHDILSGAAGNDSLNGGAGSDNLYGGDGDDTYYLDATDGYSENANEGVDTIIVGFDTTMGANIENARVSVTGDIYLQGNGLNNVITAVGGANLIWGMAGDDTIDGGAGDDVLHGWTDDDHLLGSTGNDALYGEGGDDTLDGGAGNDDLNGGAGADTMAGGGGNDTYYVDSIGDMVTENAASGTDTVRVTVDYVLTANVEHLIQVGTGELRGTGNALNNTITGDEGVSILQGDSGNDTLLGRGGDDLLYGDDGNDVLDGGDGADFLGGGRGNDSYIVDKTDDYIDEYVDEGTDTVTASASYTLTRHLENLILSGAGTLAGTGNDINNIITGGAGANSLSGEAGNDTLYGNAGEDVLHGGLGVDKLYGGDDNDSLIGQEGNDTLDGGAGDDLLHGGAGVDRLTGGAGADTFEFRVDSLGLSGSGIAVQRDTILDFSLGDGDRIDLSTIDAIAGGSDDAFTFVTKFTKQAGQAMLFYNATADTTSLRLDTDGDGKIDQEIVINGHLLTSDDAWIL